MGCNEGELSILFTDDAHIAHLNKKYLGRDGPTDVIAFPMATGSESDVKSGMLGDIVISVDRAICEAKDFVEPLKETIYRLLIHGLLHLFNYDHERSPREARIMRKEEERLLALIREE